MMSVLFEASCVKRGKEEGGMVRVSLASLLTARADLGEGPLLLAELVWGDSTLTKECKFSCMCKLFPTSWHLLQMYVCKLFQVFQSLCSSLSLGSILISLCQHSIQNTSRHPLGSVAVTFCAIFLLPFSRRKTMQLPKT